MGWDGGEKETLLLAPYGRPLSVADGNAVGGAVVGVSDTDGFGVPVRVGTEWDRTGPDEACLVVGRFVVGVGGLIRGTPTPGGAGCGAWVRGGQTGAGDRMLGETEVLSPTPVRADGTGGGAARLPMGITYPIPMPSSNAAAPMTTAMNAFTGTVISVGC
jgi:hypothetical protein